LVQEYQQQRLDAHKSRGTVNREVGVLRQAYRLAKRTETIRRVPYFPMLKEGSPRQGFAEPEQVEAIAKALPDPLADLVRFAFMTSWRRGEVQGLTWSMVDRNAGEIRIPTSKNGRGRKIPMAGDLAALIERRWKARTFGCDFVFHENGVPVGDFRKAWASACVTAEVGEKDEAGNYKGLLFHDLRRSGIRVLVRAGVPQSVVMSISGHRTISTFLRYDITSGKDQAAALEAAQAYRESKNRDKTGTK
jgi:integrase